MTPPTGRGILTTSKKLELFPFRIFVVLDILFDLIGGHPVTDGPKEISVFPELTSSQFLLDPGKLFKDLACTDALQHTRYVRNGVSWREAEKEDLCTVFSPEITCNYMIYMVIYLILTT